MKNNTISAQLVIFSHLSDIQTGFLSQLEINNKVNFIKFIINWYPDIKSEINADDEWNDFCCTKFYKPE